MTHLVVGGTGRMGSAVVAGLVARGEKARVLTRSPERAAALPAGTQSVVGDLASPGSYERAFEGARSLFLVATDLPTGLREPLAALESARRHGVSRVVFVSAYPIERGPQVPHFASKLAVERALASSGLAATVLRPGSYFQNDFWFRDALLGPGIYPLPIGSLGLAGADIRDVADAALRALADDSTAGRTLPVVATEPLSGPGNAAAWSKALGHAVRYAGDDLEPWAAQARQANPDWLVHDLGRMFALVQAGGCRPTAADVAETTALLGRPPRSYEAFVAETATAWR